MVREDVGVERVEDKGGGKDVLAFPAAGEYVSG
jgi:hypothetical protein